MRDALKFPIPVSERISFLYFERTALERDGHGLVSVSDGKAVQIPIGRTSVLMLGPGSTVSHAAISLCALEGAVVLWVGEGGVRLYAAGNQRSDASAILWQAKLRDDESSRLEVARSIYAAMFEEEPPQRRSIDQLRGLEGSRVKTIYAELATKHKIEWSGRSVADMRDPLNAAISTATAALYGLTEATVLALGFSPAIGFIHSGDARSFVFDIADTVKFKTVIPLAFEIASQKPTQIESRMRTACRDMFHNEQMAARLVAIIQKVMYANAPD